MKNRNSYWTEYKKEHYARIVIDVEPELKEKWQQKAKLQGKSLTAYIRDKLETNDNESEKNKQNRL